MNNRARAALAAIGAVIGIIAGVMEIASDEPGHTPLPVVESVEHIDTVNIEAAPLVNFGVEVDGAAVTDGVRGGISDVAAMYLPAPKPPREPIASRIGTAMHEAWGRVVTRWNQATKALSAKRRFDELSGMITGRGKL